MRKAILLLMAAAILAMFAIPGSASASWTKHHQANPNDVELEITGTDIFFDTPLGGKTCSSTISKVLFKGGQTTGTVNTFEPEVTPQTTITQDCQGRGPTAQCDVHEVTAHQLPWLIHTATSDTVTITTGSITFTTTGFLCPHTTTLTPGMVTLTVAAGETATTSTATLSGTLSAHVGSSPTTAHVSGTFHVLGTITYGI